MLMRNSALGSCPGGPRCAHRTVIHWNDSERRSQRSRFDGGIEPQSCIEVAYDLWKQIKEQVAQFDPGTRVDVPLPRVISRILGIYRAGATLKDGPMLVLELSAAEIARIAGYSKSQVEAALRWLGDGIIHYKGKAVARGLGVIQRTLRKGHMSVCGRLHGVFRTSLTALTEAGRALLGLITAPPRDNKKFDKLAFKQEKRKRVEAARRGALGRIKHAITEFWGRSLQPQAPPEHRHTAMDVEASSPWEAYYMNRARGILALQGKPLGQGQVT